MFVSACCSPGVRPEDANLFQASCGIASGEFDRQLESDRNLATSSQKVLEAEKSKSQTLKTDLGKRKAEYDRILIELDQMEKENLQIDAQIRNMQVDSAKAIKERTKLHVELRAIQDQIEVLRQKASIDQDAINQHHSEVSRLKQEIEILRMIISVQ